MRGSVGVASSLVAALMFAACGSRVPGQAEPAPGAVRQAGTPSPVPERALPGRPSDPVRLDAAGVAADAIDREALMALLDEAGFISGTERLFSTVRHGRRRTVARVLAFETPEGAARFLAWLEDHHVELIGGADPLPSPELPGAGFLVVHEPTGCCHSETRIFLAAWTSGTAVVTLEVAGPTVGEGVVEGFASRLDAAV